MRVRAVQLILRSINSSRSAYASISFINTFFDAYNIFGTAVVQAGVLAKVNYLHLAERSNVSPCQWLQLLMPDQQWSLRPMQMVLNITEH